VRAISGGQQGFVVECQRRDFLSTDVSALVCDYDKRVAELELEM